MTLVLSWRMPLPELTLTAVKAGLETGRIAAVLGPPGLAIPYGVPAVALAPNAGMIEIDVAQANCFHVEPHFDITAVSFVNWPPAGYSQRLTLYVTQPAQGGPVGITGWPSGTRFGNGGHAPQLATSPGAVSCLVFESFDGGATIFGKLAESNYQPVN